VKGGSGHVCASELTL